MDEILRCDHSIMEVAEQNFPKVVVTFESVDKIQMHKTLKYIEHYFFCGAVYYAVQSGSNI